MGRHPLRPGEREARAHGAQRGERVLELARTGIHLVGVDGALGRRRGGGDHAVKERVGRVPFAGEDAVVGGDDGGVRVDALEGADEEGLLLERGLRLLRPKVKGLLPGKGCREEVEELPAVGKIVSPLLGVVGKASLRCERAPDRPEALERCNHDLALFRSGRGQSFARCPGFVLGEVKGEGAVASQLGGKHDQAAPDGLAAPLVGLPEGEQRDDDGDGGLGTVRSRALGDLKEPGRLLVRKASGLQFLAIERKEGARVLGEVDGRQLVQHECGPQVLRDGSFRLPHGGLPPLARVFLTIYHRSAANVRSLPLLVVNCRRRCAITAFW